MTRTYQEKFKQLLLRCQKSPSFFIENFCKVKHPKAGVIDFRLFKYQKSSIQAFLNYRYNIYRKCRQCGISTLSGAYALWYGMFFPHKTILIVSKRDEDAMAFLNKNVKFVYDHLPIEFKSVYGDPPPTYNEHTIVFPNGSMIKSLTSSPDTLRSNSASLNIIDEAAFMPKMDAMWTAGQPTLQHGGNVIVISTTNGVGNWYHLTWEDAEKHENDFNPITVNWWDMDWQIKYTDEVTQQECILQPTKDIRNCTTKEEINRWGPKYSPWLEEQYRQLQQKGEAHKFRQEVLAEFLGSGNTVITREILLEVSKQVADFNDRYYTVNNVPYIHPVTGEKLNLDFDNELHIFRKPVRPEPDVVENGRVIQQGRPGHTYCMGVDISSGEADDFSGVEVIDITAKEQVAELNIRVLPRVLLLMVDYIGRYYNGAFCVPERTGLGIPFCHSLYMDIGYYNIYRMLMPSGKRSKKVGYPTSPVYKPAINKALMDMLGDQGITLHSRRLFQQLSIYVHLTAPNGRVTKKTGAVEGPGNHDDLTIATGLSLLGLKEAVQADSTALIPMRHSPTADPEDDPSPTLKITNPQDQLQDLVNLGGMNALMPVIVGQGADSSQLTPQEMMMRFAAQLGGTTIQSKNANPAFLPRRHIITYPKKQ
jgi:hypothetical protein